MNPFDRASLEASQRFVDAGIALETDCVWALNAWPITVDGHIVYKEEWQLIETPMIGYKNQYPAPSMAEVWRELPEVHGMNVISIYKESGKTRVYPMPDFNALGNTNPTDALIDLLIWVRKKKP